MSTSWPGDGGSLGDHLRIVSNREWEWLINAITSIHQDIEGLRILMANTAADLTAELDNLKATVQSEAGAEVTLGNALDAIIAKLNTLPPAGVMTQAELDAAVSEATTIATEATANAASLAAAAGKAVDANTPVTPPAPTPTPTPPTPPATP